MAGWAAAGWAVPPSAAAAPAALCRLQAGIHGGAASVAARAAPAAAGAAAVDGGAARGAGGAAVKVGGASGEGHCRQAGREGAYEDKLKCWAALLGWQSGMHSAANHAAAGARSSSGNGNGSSRRARTWGAAAGPRAAGARLAPAAGVGGAEVGGGGGHGRRAHHRVLAGLAHLVAALALHYRPRLAPPAADEAACTGTGPSRTQVKVGEGRSSVEAARSTLPSAGPRGRRSTAARRPRRRPTAGAPAGQQPARADRQQGRTLAVAAVAKHHTRAACG